MKPVFLDPTLRRRRVLRVLAAALVVVSAAMLAVFALTLFVAPVLPAPFVRVAHRILPPLHRHARTTAASRAARRKLLAQIARERPAANASSQGRIVAAFYAPWEETGLHSLEANASQMTHLMPAWLRIGADGASLDETDWDPTVAFHNLDVLRIAREHNVRVLPVLSNAAGGWFDPERAHRLLANPAAQQRVAVATRDWLLRNRMQGINLDFESLSAEDAPLLVPFVTRVHQVLAPAGLQVTADVQASTEPEVWREIAAQCDFVVVMGYDQHSASGAPGPIAALDWFRDTVDRAAKNVPADKLVIGMGNYAYDWPEHEEASPLSYQQALMAARDAFGDAAAPGAIDFDPAALNATFDYKDEQGVSHEVWMLDAVTAANEWRLVSTRNVRGVALWALGLEDPSVWQILGDARVAQPPHPDHLRTISFRYAVDFLGEGEVLQVAATPVDGHRELEIDPATGLCLDEQYTSFPAAYVIRRSSYVPKAVALTIDDGPSDPYTSDMLDVLRQYHVHATFFVIGENVEHYPDLLARIWEEGHEIGNHSYTHPNIGTVSPRRAMLELNATQRAIESVIGRSTVLFRPPYNADAEPTTREEVMPVIRAAELGYVTVGEFIDPQDWQAKPRAAELARSILRGIQSGHGNCVLLHDGGGDRSATVDAMRIVIPELQREGYRFVTVSDLMHTSRAAVMPPVAVRERVFLGDDRVIFGATSTGQRLLAFAFLAAIFLGIARVVILALIAMRARQNDAPEGTNTLTVSVIIAAYNEERVIAKTIASILRARHAVREIIVIDDGSTDNTAAVVEQLAEKTPMIRLLRQPNQGKAAALNHGIASAVGDVFVAIDADTVLHPDAIGNLLRHFDDDEVGAVAGNVKVGNRRKLTTLIQSIEYTTSQNLDRRAWAALNAVTVVPGAIGAWRRDAVAEAGGYTVDTMAEDMDLTWRLRRNGWRIACDIEAMSFTEAPESVKALFRQRFRWSYGTLQCLWKHRDALGRYGWFGMAMLPSLWLFQIVFQLLSPIVDAQLLWIGVQLATGTPVDARSLVIFGGLFALFTLLDLTVSAFALRAEGESLRELPLLVLQRFFYRQLMYAAIVKSVLVALQGMRTGWNKLERRGTVTAV
ncbi:MAG: glycosyltransferase [Acidobacteria bacterium]|nr:glycosyltransferase [Acidobacteriota bacterium]MBV9477614.1 glycosyltransferase [Acidobacteriota bacterium]